MSLAGAGGQEVHQLILLSRLQFWTMSGVPLGAMATSYKQVSSSGSTKPEMGWQYHRASLETCSRLPLQEEWKSHLTAACLPTLTRFHSQSINHLTKGVFSLPCLASPRHALIVFSLAL